MPSKLLAVALALAFVALAGCYAPTNVEASCFTRPPEGFREWAYTPDPEVWVCGNRTYYECRTMQMENGTRVWGCGN